MTQVALRLLRGCGRGAGCDSPGWELADMRMINRVSEGTGLAHGGSRGFPPAETFAQPLDGAQQESLPSLAGGVTEVMTFTA